MPPRGRNWELEVWEELPDGSKRNLNSPEVRREFEKQTFQRLLDLTVSEDESNSEFDPDNPDRYDNGMGDPATQIRRAFARLPPHQQRELASELARKQGLLPEAARASSAPKELKPSELPPGTTWPTETYSGSPEARRGGGGGIVVFLERVWQPLIEAGAADLRTLRERDPSAAMAVNNYRRGGRQLPAHLHLLTVKEANNRALETISPDVLRAATRPAPSDELRLARVQQSRRRYAKPHH